MATGSGGSALDLSIDGALGETLRALRLEREVSQADLGAKAGLSGTFLGEVERVGVKPATKSGSKGERARSPGTTGCPTPSWV